jgi:release factor glutamine methyltransferase
MKLRELQNQCEIFGVSKDLSLSYARQLLEQVTQKKISRILLIEKGIDLLHEQLVWLHNALERLRDGEPLQYIIGEVQFLDCTIKIHRPLLIPRVETEEWVAQLIAYIQKHHIQPRCILDLGTGSGCIALALAKAFPTVNVVGVDSNENSINLAYENAHMNHIQNVQFIKSDVYEQISTEIIFDLIVSNPPYVRESDWQSLDSSVRQWEDKDAIVARDDGLAIIKRIVKGAAQRLSLRRCSSAILWIEIDMHQGGLAKKLFIDAGFIDVHIIQDMYGRDRVVWGIKGLLV